MSNITEQLIGYSIGGNSTWFLYRPQGLLFDCGEGASLQLNDKIFAVNKIFLSHEHTDHLSGLLSFIGARATRKGDNKKELSIYYTKSDFVYDYLNIICEHRKNSYTLHFHQWNDLDEIKINDTISVVPYNTGHTSCSLGYYIVEKRKRLNPKYSDLSQELLNRLGTSLCDKDVEYNKIIFQYSGDSPVLRTEYYAETETLLHECTFLDNTEYRPETKHTVLSDLFAALKDCKNLKNLILFHFSNRYTMPEINTAVLRAATVYKIACNIFVQYEHNLVQLQ